MATWVSRRASGAPRQWCRPKPNPRCRLSGRPRSSRSGSSKASGSRLAEPISSRANSPFSRHLPAHREVPEHGPPGQLDRRDVAQQLLGPAAGQRRGRPAGGPAGRGGPSSASTPPLIRFTVVSCPATSSRMQVESSSPSLRVSPPSSARASWLSRSGPGSRRRSASSTKKYSAKDRSLQARPADLVGEEEVGVEAAGQGGRPRPEPVLVGDRHAEHVADDAHREGVGEVGHRVDLAALEGPRPAARSRPAGSGPAGPRPCAG